MKRFISRHDKGETNDKALVFKRKHKMTINDSNMYNLMYGRKAAHFFELDQAAVNPNLEYQHRFDIAMNIIKPLK